VAVFERFTELARQAVVLAQEEARGLNHNYIGTEHILLGLVREEQSLAALVLDSFGITVERVRAQVVRIVGTGEEVWAGQIPFTPRAKKVLKLALGEALKLSHSDITTDHLLLGLLVEKESVAARVLRDFGADVRELRDAVLADLDGAPDEPSPLSKDPGSKPFEERAMIIIDRFRQQRESELSEPAPDATGMFERFTEHARQVVLLAQEEARGLKHNHVGTEHILIGLLREDGGPAALVLASLDITIEGARAGVIGLVPPGEDLVSGQIPFTPRTKKVLELALREALSLGHIYIGTEHILLALAREGAGIANRVLLDFEVDSEKIRNEVIRMISGPGGRARGSRPRAPSGTDRSDQDATSTNKKDDPPPKPLSDQELEGMIEQLTAREQEVSYERRVLRGKIDILRADLADRRKRRDTDA